MTSFRCEPCAGRGYRDVHGCLTGLGDLRCASCGGTGFRVTRARAGLADPIPGDMEGEVCCRGGCAGVIEVRPVENCCCHISPPCSSCTEPREFCAACGWEAKDDEQPFNDHLVRSSHKDPNGAWLSMRERPLDPTKIDWRSKAHTHFSMIKEGVYPESGDENADRAAVAAQVRGTFGGRFNQFGGGRFSYVAYTD